MSAPQQQITIDGDRRIGFREAGAGFPVLLMHGIGSGSPSFNDQLNELGDRFRLIAWDTPGYGGSDDSPLPNPAPADYAADALALLDALGVDEAHILGHSLGGLIGTALVARHPDRIRQVVLSSPAGGYGALDAESSAAKVAGRVEQMTRLGPVAMASERAPGMLASGASDAIRERAIDIMARLRPDGYLSACKLLANGNALAEVRRWPTPPPATLVLVGAQDRTTPPPGVRRIAHCIANARYVEIENAAHAAYLEQPERYNELLREFLMP
jgi:pimeloyl-ACP methyl ester carboxylesterase